MDDNNSKKSPFFIGYLPIPASLAAYYKILITLIILIGVALGLWLAGSQKSAGEGTVELFEESTLSGYLTMEPYPVLHQVNGTDRSVILIDRYKKSANHIVEDYANSWISLSGLIVQRGEWEMLQLPPGTTISSASPNESFKISESDLGEVNLNGEIIDSKCFLGAMKPGGGKVHRACARLCLLGGVPPMFVAKNADGNRFGYLLMNPDGSSASIELADKVAIPVNITGTLIQRGNFQYIKLTSNNIQTLSGNKLNNYGETLEEASLALSEGESHHHPVAVSHSHESHH